MTVFIKVILTVDKWAHPEPVNSLGSDRVDDAGSTAGAVHCT
jgi:hypothetical protein